MRFYISELYMESPTMILTAVRDHVDNFVCVDGRSNPESHLGFVWAECDPDPATHAAMVADPRITYVPIEDALGNGINLNHSPIDNPDFNFESPIALIPNINIVKTLLENKGIPIGSYKSVRELVTTIIKTLCITQMLESSNPVTDLDIVLPSVVLTTARNKLNNRGFNTNISGTRRDFINHLIIQNNPYLRTHHDK